MGLLLLLQRASLGSHKCQSLKAILICSQNKECFMTLEDLNLASKLRKLLFSLELFILKRPHKFVWHLGRWVAGDTCLLALSC